MVKIVDRLPKGPSEEADKKFSTLCRQPPVHLHEAQKHPDHSRSKCVGSIHVFDSNIHVALGVSLLDNNGVVPT